VPQHGDRAVVGPVQVVHRQHDGCGRGPVDEEAGDPVEQTRAQLVGAQRRRGGVEEEFDGRIGGVGAEGLGEGVERQRTRALEAPAGQHLCPAPSGLDGQLGE
jgi:hypothetical protein